LIKLTRKETVWQWKEKEQQAFEFLHNKMCSKPVLQQPDFTCKFYIHTDASSYGAGAILLQESTDQTTKKPKQHLIAYYSTTFTPTKQNYDVYEQELLAIIKALDHWKAYLKMTVKPFTIVTDHTCYRLPGWGIDCRPCTGVSSGNQAIFPQSRVGGVHFWIGMR
jgi:hypothetical protein